MPRGEVIDLALKELSEFFPNVAQAKLVKAHVVKEVRATYSAVPGLEKQRPLQKTNIPNLFLAGDWTRNRLASHYGGRGAQWVSGGGSDQRSKVFVA